MVNYKKNSVYRVTIEGYSSEGMGIAKLDGGFIVFVREGIVGEIYDIKLVKVLKNMAFAIIDNVCVSSKDRQTPDCPYYRRCGGCAFRHMSYSEELRAKTNRVNDALHRLGGLDVSITHVCGSEKTEAYRNKATYFAGLGNKLGFYRARSHDLQRAERCILQDEYADKCRNAIERWMRDFSIPVYDEKKGVGLLRSVQVRSCSGGILVSLVCTSEKVPDSDELCKYLREECNVLAGIVINVNSGKGNTILGGRNIVLWGNGFVDDNMCGMNFRISTNSFYQINRPQAEKIYKRAAELIQPKDKLILDLYCGTGTIGLTMASQCKKLIGCEIVEQAVDDAKANAERNNVKNADFLCGDAGQIARRFADMGLKPDGILVDPPRKGLDDAVIEALIKMDAERIVYISCDPATLARDLKKLSKDGLYTVDVAESYDFFPRCAHVESIVLLKKTRSDLN